ncbi:MAG: mitochondrial carrier domain-containing protein [Piptocephalis tieghemiana]|nr:MAG: mitochondrial carrier domain-containing protein [Piptocephalis tieghemiana]
MTQTSTPPSVVPSQPIKKHNPNPGPSLTHSILAGSMGGVGLILAGHPFDLVKVLAQTSGAGKSVTHLVRDLVGPPLGLRGLYRGVLPPLLGATPICALSFGGYGLGCQVMTPPHATSSDPSQLSLPRVAGAGAISALASTLVLGPAERMKILMQTQTTPPGHPGYIGVLEMAKRTYAVGGIQSIFRGTGMTLLRDAPGSAVYFVLYEFLRRGTQDHLTSDAGRIMSILLAGGFAGMGMWTVIMPMDTLKSRLQMARDAPGSKQPTLSFILRSILRTEGFQGLFRGLGPAMLRAFPANAACFFGYEGTLALLR